MKNIVLSGLCCAAVAAILPETASAHGGQYRGPGDVVPPSPGGGGRSGGPSGPTTGGPAGPSAPAPSGPATGGPAGPTTGGPTGPSGSAGPTTGGRGEPIIGDDLSTWDYWWEFNKDPFIRLREAVHAGGTQTGSDDFYLGSTRKSEARDSLRPTSDDIKTIILPALKKALDNCNDQRDISSSCMVAMAKIGQDHPDFKLTHDVFVPRISHADLEVHQTAALAVGIAAIAGEEEVNLLVDLVLDRGQGRAAAGGTVDKHTRSFATYGLGLLSNKTTNIEIKKQAFAALKEVLLDEKLRDRDVKVAAINAMGILNIGTSGEAEKALLKEVVGALEEFYNQKLGAGSQLIQAHCPPAIAKLIGRDHELADHFKQLFAADLQEKGAIKRSGNEIPESCTLALGQLVKPYDDKDAKKCPDKEYSELLLDTWRKHKDVQTKNFAMLSLGWIGGELNKEIILKEFDKAGKSLEKPWCALALGVFSHFKYEEQKKRNDAKEVERFIGETLYDALKKNNDPALVGALGVSLGLCQYKEAADEMRTRMIDNQPKEDMAGYLAIGLALMDDTRSINDLRKVVTDAIRRPKLLLQGSVALGKLGDKEAALQLSNLMTDEGQQNLAQLSALSSAIGFIGDKRTIEPLKKMLFDDKLGALSRAFAAVALGGIADKEPMPWNSKLAVNMNYRASVETLTNKATGVLDIL